MRTPQEAGDKQPIVPETDDSHRRKIARGLSRAALALLVLLCGVTLLLGFLNKDRCTGPEFDASGRSQPDYFPRVLKDVCYSDIHFLWIGRDIERHVFPYVHGGITPSGELHGGSVEYPVLTGMLMWIGALFAHNDHQFLVGSAIVLTPFALLTTWLLGRLARWRALLWALSPPLILYAFHNWDLPPVACVVGAVCLVHRGWGGRAVERPLRTRAALAAVLLGLGFAFKLYPAILVLPLMLYVATGGLGGRELPAGKRRDVAGALRVGLAAATTAVAVNLPFMLAGFRGWMASFTFQASRGVDVAANSIWYWVLQPSFPQINKRIPGQPVDYNKWFPDRSEGYQEVVQILSPILILVMLAVASVLGWKIYKRTGTYPWVGVSAAMICGFLLLHKVHSPQYTLWLLPMFVLLRVRWEWVVAFLLTDLALGIGIFRYVYGLVVHGGHQLYDGYAGQATMVGVWGGAAVLIALFFAFMSARNIAEETSRDTAREKVHRSA